MTHEGRKKRTHSATSPTNPDPKSRRMEPISDEDFTAKLQKSLENPDIKQAFTAIVTQNQLAQLEARSIQQENDIKELKYELMKTTGEKDALEGELQQLLQYKRRNATHLQPCVALASPCPRPATGGGHWWFGAAASCRPRCRPTTLGDRKVPSRRGTKTRWTSSPYPGEIHQLQRPQKAFWCLQENPRNKKPCAYQCIHKRRLD